MNWDRVQGNWKQLKGKIKEQWGKLTDDELDQISGNRDQLVGKIQERYGIAKDEAERQLERFSEECGCGDEAGAVAGQARGSMSQEQGGRSTTGGSKSESTAGRKW